MNYAEIFCFHETSLLACIYSKSLVTMDQLFLWRNIEGLAHSSVL